MQDLFSERISSVVSIMAKKREEVKRKLPKMNPIDRKVKRD